jgi:HEAT repeat protein
VSKNFQIHRAGLLTIALGVCACAPAPAKSPPPRPQPKANASLTAAPQPEANLAPISAPPASAPGSACATALLQRLQSSDTGVRYNAAHEAGKVSTEPACPDLHAELGRMTSDKAEAAGVRDAAAVALARLAPDAALRLFRTIEAEEPGGVSLDACIALGPMVLPWLRERVRSPKRNLLEIAALASVVAEHPGAAQSLETLWLLLEILEWDERSAALASRALGAFGQRLTSELVHALESRDVEMRRRAARTLGMIGKDAAPARAALERAARADPSADVRSAAQQALALILRR